MTVQDHRYEMPDEAKADFIKRHRLRQDDTPDVVELACRLNSLLRVCVKAQSDECCALYPEDTGLGAVLEVAESWSSDLIVAVDFMTPAHAKAGAA